MYYLAIFVPSQVNTSGCPFLTNVRLTLSEFHPYFLVSGHVIKFQDQTTDVANSLYFDPFGILITKLGSVVVVREPVIIQQWDIYAFIKTS